MEGGAGLKTTQPQPTGPAAAATSTIKKWQAIFGQYLMENLELFNIVEEVRNVSNALVVLPKNVNAENAAKMETDDKSKREQLLQGVQRLKARMDMIAAASVKPMDFGA